MTRFRISVLKEMPWSVVCVQCEEVLTLKAQAAIDRNSKFNAQCLLTDLTSVIGMKLPVKSNDLKWSDVTELSGHIWQ